MASWRSSHTPEPVHDDRLFLYLLWRSLSHGSEPHNRPALPTELVIAIFRLADLCVPISVPNMSWNTTNASTVESWGPRELRACRHTHRLTASHVQTLRTSLARFEIGITSRDQGWVGDRHSASYSWFEIALCDRVLPVKPRMVVVPPGESGGGESVVKPLMWRTHENEVAGRDLRNVTVTIGPEHEMWKWVEEGDFIGLIACAMYPGWSNTVHDTSFRFFKYFEPAW